MVEVYGFADAIASRRVVPAALDRTRRVTCVTTPGQSFVRDERIMKRFPDQSFAPALTAGTAVEVRGSFRGEWSRGFEVAEATHDGYWVRRLSDRCVLPVEFMGDDIRRVG